MKSNRHYVYIMSSQQNGTLYIGVTNDLSRRVWEHKMKQDAASFTARYNCTMLVYFEEWASINDAISREKQLKRRGRNYKKQLIESVNPNWLDFASSSDFWMG